MKTLREFIEQLYPEASKTHQWVPEAGDDNIECFECSVRPYNAEAKRLCIDRVGASIDSIVDARRPF